MVEVAGVFAVGNESAVPAEVGNARLVQFVADFPAEVALPTRLARKP